MSNPILGKWQEVSQEGIDEFYQAIGFPDPAGETEASFEFKVDEEGNYTEIFDSGSSVTTRVYTSGVETDEGITTTVEGNVINETDKLPNGNVMNVKRTFEEDKMVTTLSSPNTGDVTATITFQRV